MELTDVDNGSGLLLGVNVDQTVLKQQRRAFREVAIYSNYRLH
jgi:hypothetical protein